MQQSVSYMNASKFFYQAYTNCAIIRDSLACNNFFIFTWFSGELGREAQDELEDDGDRGSSLIQTPVEWQMRYFKAAV